MGTPLVADGALYSGGSDGALYAIDAQTGHVLWSKDGFEAIESANAIIGDVIIAGGQSKRVMALDRRNGKELWAFDASAFVFSPPLIVKDAVYVVTYDQLHALDLKTGRPKWAVDIGSQPSFVSTPAYRNGTVFVSFGSTLLAVEGSTGVERWRVRSNKDFWGLALGGQHVYVGNSDGYFYAYDQKTGQERWSFKSRRAASDDIWSSPAVASGKVYVGSRDRYVYALDADTGRRIWDFETAGESVGDPVVGGGMVYVSDSNHLLPLGMRRLHALDAGSGAESWRFELSSTLLLTPALGKGVLYVPVAGQILALK